MSEKYVGVVDEFFDEGNDKPLGVSFGIDAIILFLPRDHPQYKKWLALLQKSYREGIKLEYAYSFEGQVLTHLKKAK